MENNDQTGVQTQQKSNISLSNRGVVLTSFDDLWRFSKAISVSGLAPKGIDKPESIMVALQLGMEIGLSPMRSLQSIAVINGKPSIYGDAAIAMVRASSACEYVNESYVGEGEQLTAICKSKRHGGEEHITTFSVEEAKKANLWNKNSVWQQYGKRMLIFRARGFNLRDNFADILGGYHLYEEVRDYEPIKEGPSVEMKVEKVANSIKDAVKKVAAKAIEPKIYPIVPSQAVATEPKQELAPNTEFANESKFEHAIASFPVTDEQLKILNAFTDPYSDEALEALSLDGLKELCVDNGLDYTKYEGKNTKKKLKTLIWEKRHGMPSSINLEEGDPKTPPVAEVPAEAKETPKSDGFVASGLEGNGNRSFPNMKLIYDHWASEGFDNERVLKSIKDCGYSFASKEDAARRANAEEINRITFNC